MMALVFMFNVVLPESRKKVYYGRVGSQQQLASLQGQCPTKRAPDAGESGAIPSIFLRLIIFPVGRRPAARPSAGNAHRWATCRVINETF